jgi:protein ImuB
LQRLARGTEEHFLVPEEPAFTLSDHVGLDTPLESLDSLLFVFSPMLDRLLKQATNHAYALRSVSVSLDLDRGSPHEFEIRPAVPAQNRDLLLKLLNLKLQTHAPQAGIVGVTLSAEPAIPQVAQRGLFQSQFPEPDKLDLLLARLCSIVGEPNVGCPELRNTHCDDEFLMVAFQPTAESYQPVTTPAARLALRRFRPPQPARVLFRGSTPSLVYWKGERLQIESAAGPWQSSGYWWDGRRWETDEWDAAVGIPMQTLRLRYDREQRSWYVAGLYD